MHDHNAKNLLKIDRISNWLFFYAKHHPSEITQETWQPLRQHETLSRVASDHVMYATSEKKASVERVCFLHMKFTVAGLRVFARKILEFRTDAVKGVRPSDRIVFRDGYVPSALKMTWKC